MCVCVCVCVCVRNNNLQHLVSGIRSSGDLYIYLKKT